MSLTDTPVEERLEAWGRRFQERQNAGVYYRFTLAGELRLFGGVLPEEGAALSVELARQRLDTLSRQLDENRAHAPCFTRGIRMAFLEPLIGQLQGAIEDAEYWAYKQSERQEARGR